MGYDTRDREWQSGEQSGNHSPQVTLITGNSHHRQLSEVDYRGNISNVDDTDSDHPAPRPGDLGHGDSVAMRSGKRRLVRWVARRMEPIDRAIGGFRNLDPTQSRLAPELVPRPQQSFRHSPRRGKNFYLLAAGVGCWADQQLA